MKVELKEYKNIVNLAYTYKYNINTNKMNMDATIIRNIKDFQMLFNQMSETCFKTCVSTFLSRDVTNDEIQCVENCSNKHINANHKIMEVFMEEQPAIIRRNKEEQQRAQEALEAAQKDQNSENSA